MPFYSRIAHSLNESLRLTQPAVAVCLTQEVPDGIESWSGDIPAGCRFWQEAGERVFATSARDHAHCSIGQYTHRLDMNAASQTDLQDALKVFASLTYVREEDI